MDNINELAAALAKAQGEIEPAPKDLVNPFYSSRYSSLRAIREAMREAFAKHGLCVVHAPSVVDGKLTLSTILIHESGQSLECGQLVAEIDMNNPQQMGTAITYFRRYALAAISQTVADEDDDGNAASGKPPQNKRQPPKLSIEDAKLIANATKEIAEATSSVDIVTIGNASKEQYPVAVQNVLRPLLVERYRALEKKEKQSADSGSDPAPDQG